MTRKSFSPLRFGVIIFLFILGITIFSNKEDAKKIVKIFLESSWPAVTIWLLAIVGVFAERFFARAGMDNRSGVMYQSFGKYADSIFTVATFGLAGSTSLALLKGLYLQLFFGGTFFSGFGDFDLSSIFLISSFLLFHSVSGTTRLILNAVFQAEATDVAPIQS